MAGRMAALRPGDQVPHFEVTREDGTALSYRELWQRRNLLLVVLPADAHGAYRRQLDRHLDASAARNTEIVVTPDDVEGVPRFGAVVADQWGEVVFAAGGDTAADLPRPAELAEWLEYVQTKCPECEGESR